MRFIAGINVLLMSSFQLKILYLIVFYRMRFKIYFSLFFCFCLSGTSQTNSSDNYIHYTNLSDSTFEAVLRKTYFGKTQLIFVRGNEIVVDTMIFNNVKEAMRDSTIKVNYKDGGKSKLKSEDFWGLVTESKQVKRYIDGKFYTICDFEEPYIYQIGKKGHERYFYSLTLQGGFYMLHESSIKFVTNPDYQAYLMAYLHKVETEKKENERLKKEKSGIMDDDTEQTIVETINLIFNILKAFSK